ncbi:MAG: outer membrane beta-barrel protein [Ferruginibacter sp.]
MQQKLFTSVFILAICTSLSSFAQSRVALKAGPTFDKAHARYYGNDLPSKFGVGGNLGLQVSAELEPPLYFMGVVLLNQKSFSVQPDTGSISNYDYRLNYLSIAPMFSYHLPTGTGNFFAISAGPMGSFGISGKEKLTKNNITTSRKLAFSTSSDISIIDLSAYTSAGYHTSQWFAELAYEHGFVNLNHETPTDGRDLQNRTLSFNIGVYIR